MFKYASDSVGINSNNDERETYSTTTFEVKKIIPDLFLGQLVGQTIINLFIEFNLTGSTYPQPAMLVIRIEFQDLFL